MVLRGVFSELHDLITLASLVMSTVGLLSYLHSHNTIRYFFAGALDDFRGVDGLSLK